jgi:hypothetical protein
MKRSANEFEFSDDEDIEGDGVNIAGFRDVLLNKSDWTTDTILSQLKKVNIDITPRFQRRDAWTVRRKSQFIESLILNIPIPELVLADQKNSRGKLLVLDGKQRLLTLLQFAGEATGKYNAFNLNGLEVLEHLNGYSFQDLKDKHPDDFNMLLNSTIRSVVIKNWPNEKFLHIVFHRLNTNSVRLSPQELRQALFPGDFVHALFDRASENKSLQTLLGLDEPDFRMRDVEIMLRFIAFHFYLHEYSGNLRDFLDQTCKTLNLEWQVKKREIKNLFSEFDAAILAAMKIFGVNSVGRKWLGNTYEGALNKAILDCMFYYFSNANIRSSAEKNKEKVVKAFKQLCEQDLAFRQSIETTTKSLNATHTRLKAWGYALKNILPGTIKVPTRDKASNRIKP